MYVCVYLSGCRCPGGTHLLRRQIHLTEENLRKLADLQARQGAEQRAQIADFIQSLRQNVTTLEAYMDASIERAHSTRKRIQDPQWIEEIRARTRREADSDPALVAGVTLLIEARS